MSRLFGYDAQVVLTDNQGRRLVIDAIELDTDTARAVIELENVRRAMSEARLAGPWGSSGRPTSPLWRVES